MSVTAQGVTKYAKWSLGFCKKVVRYLALTYDQGITLHWSCPVDDAVRGSRHLITWTDASFAGFSTKSQTGVVIAWAGSVILWRSSRQTSSALSTCEAEVSAAATGWQIVEGLRALLHEWSCELDPPLLLVDNKSALRVAELGGTWRTRYFAVRAARLAEESAAGRVDLRYCPTLDMMADALTKTAGEKIIGRLRGLCDGDLPNIPDESACYKNADSATWWGKGLEADYIKASFLALSRTAAASMCTARPRTRTPATSARTPTTSTSRPTSTPSTTPPPTAPTDNEARLLDALRGMMVSLASPPQPQTGFA